MISPTRRRHVHRLPYSPESAATARALLSHDLRRAGASPEVVADAQLVLTELVANGVEHGEPLADQTIAVTWTVDREAVEVCVADGGHVTALRPDVPPVHSPRGRGLALVAALSKRWWVELSRTTTVHAVVTG
ncbi:ATP-binding protein [Nocardioides sp. SYSU DS0663]|uniref:ATP-binding protein n=1 Tax=Nocardioides sp. SYSU DS0663 TaxID=3416445 RepID=UPI003F4C1A51